MLASCGEEPAPPPKLKPKPRSQTSAPSAAEAPALAPSHELQASGGEGGNAAEVLRRYYALIEARRYAEAYRLREPDRTDAQAFAAHFSQFASQKVTIGTPSEPVESGNWRYVEVPVQTYGTMRSGKPFGSAGTVTLRRPKAGGAWSIYTK